MNEAALLALHFATLSIVSLRHFMVIVTLSLGATRL